MWPAEISEIQYKSNADQSLQPAMFYPGSGSSPKPLLVGLHQWSYRYQQIEKACTFYAQWCIERNWAFVYPDFRGPNTHPDACGSDLAIGDILSSVDFSIQNAAVDQSRIYLVGVSGGDHAALLTAARFPGIWAAVSAWVCRGVSVCRSDHGR